MAKSEFVQLAHVFEPKKHLASGAFASEKLDGFRVIWDSGITRGMPKEEVPWANLEKDERYTSQQIATGLWTRYGNIVHAPDWWIDQLPPFMTDGELYMGRGTFQKLRSIASRLPENRNEEDWQSIEYRVFDIPSPDELFKPREIKFFQGGRTTILEIKPEALVFARKRLSVVPAARAFQNVLIYLKKNLKANAVVRAHDQTQLPFSTEQALAWVYEKLDEITDLGGEGIILRRPQSIWIPERVHDMVKVKKLQDAEATVVGYVTGRSTDKGSKLRGLMGALIVKYGTKTFELSGFSSEERVLESENVETRIPHTQLRSFEDAEYSTTPILVDPKAFLWCYDNPSPPNGPGTKVPDWITNPVFPRWSVITFRYRELSKDGIPKEARYWRIPLLK